MNPNRNGGPEWGNVRKRFPVSFGVGHYRASTNGKAVGEDIEALAGRADA